MTKYTKKVKRIIVRTSEGFPVSEICTENCRGYYNHLIEMLEMHGKLELEVKEREVPDYDRMIGPKKS